MSEQLKAFQAAIEADAGLQKKEVKAASDAATEILEERDLARLSGGMVSEFQYPPDFGPVNKVYTKKQIELIACAEANDAWFTPEHYGAYVTRNWAWIFDY